MADLKIYHVIFDENEDVVETKNMGDAPVVTRVVAVLATSAVDARKKASVLIGQRGQ